MGHKVKDFPWSKTTLQYHLANYHVCERRTRSLAKRLAHTPDILQTYGDISEQELRGFIEQVETTSSPTNVLSTFHIIQ